MPLPFSSLLQFTVLCLLCKPEIGLLNIFPLPTNMMLRFVSRGRWRNVAGGRGFPSPFWCAGSACGSPGSSSSSPSSSFLLHPLRQFRSTLPLVRYSLASRGKTSSKIHYHGTTVTPFYPVSPDCTAEEAPNQVNKMTDSVYVSQSLTPVTPVLAPRAINKVATVAGMEAMRGRKTQTLPTQD